VQGEKEEESGRLKNQLMWKEEEEMEEKRI
jgi:hypothetical protein